MKEIFKPLFILLAAISMTSCTDMLDIKPTTFVSDDLIWQDKKLIDQFVANTYGTLVAASTVIHRDGIRTGLPLSAVTSMPAPTTSTASSMQM